MQTKVDNVLTLRFEVYSYYCIVIFCTSEWYYNSRKFKEIIYKMHVSFDGTKT